MLTDEERQAVERAASVAAEAAVERLERKRRGAPDRDPYRVRYVVEGAGTFPVDMLRYDSSHPCSERDSGVMSPVRGKAAKRRRVSLEHVGDRPGWKPTRERWESFGWRVIGTV